MAEIKNYVAEYDLFLKLLKIRVESASREHAEVSLPFMPFHHNAWGAVHGGVISALADAAFGAAANHESEYAVVTLSANISYLKPGFSGPVRAEANAVHLGSKIVEYDVNIYDGSGELIAKGMLIGFVSNKLLKDCLLVQS